MKDCMRHNLQYLLHKTVLSSLALTLAVLPIGGTFAAAAPGDSTMKVRIMETTDIHTNLLPYDYYKSVTSLTVGLARTATLVKQAREEVGNTLLVDNGDLIQGTPLGTYKALVDPLKENEFHPVYKAMNLMGYDVLFWIKRLKGPISLILMQMCILMTKTTIRTTM
jgi:2',3'-cyclic-nucleotide 2'-phosphodiesterase/3'-nucleotidase/5'-nucleotidase